MSETRDQKSLVWWAKELEGIDPGEVRQERAKLFVEAAKTVWNLPSERTRRQLDITNVRMYEQKVNPSLSDFGARDGSGISIDMIGIANTDPREASTYNVAKSAIDTSVSQIASTNQRARFVTVRGNPSQRLRARKLQSFSDGLAHELQLHEKRKRKFKDAAVTESGKGFLYFFAQGKKVECQRVLPMEIGIDPLDGYVDGQPRTLYRRRPVPRAWALAYLAKDEVAKAAIKAANCAVTTFGQHSDQIEIFEGWHLATSEDSGDGWHIVALDREDGALIVEEFKSKRHRLVPFSLEDSFGSVWGTSLMSQARPLQTQININLLRIARAQRLFSAGHIYIDRTAHIKKEQINNQIGSIWIGTGPNAPKKVEFNAATKEMYEQVEKDAQRIFDILGINRGAATGLTSLGANAPAEALREETEKSDKRNSDRQQRWEQNHLDCMAVALDVVREIVETHGNYQVSVPKQIGPQNTRRMSMVDWKESALDEEDYVLQIYPASPIPTEPRGLAAFGKDMIANGAWDGRRLDRYMSSLDADAKVDLESAKEDRLEHIFEGLLYEKNYVAIPDEFVDFELAIDIGSKYLSLAEEDGVSERNLEKARRYLRKCQARKDALDAKAAAAQNAQVQAQSTNVQAPNPLPSAVQQ